MNNKLYEAVKNYEYTQRICVTENQAKQIEQLESFYREKVRDVLETIQYSVLNDEVLKLDPKDYQMLLFLKDDLEAFFTVLGFEEYEQWEV